MIIGMTLDQIATTGVVVFLVLVGFFSGLYTYWRYLAPKEKR